MAVCIFVAVPCCWNHSVTAVEVSFENINSRIPVLASYYHSSKSLIRRNTLESLSILVKQVDAGICRRAWLRCIEAHGPYVSRKVPERGVQVSKVCAPRRTIEVLTLVDIGTFTVWGRRNEQEDGIIGRLVSS